MRDIKIQIDANELDEIDIGFHMFYGCDEIGEFHAIQIGVLLFTMTIFNYRKKLKW